MAPAIRTGTLVRMAADFMRIGDAERDEAVGMLREHHATGRLSAEEFDDRMSKALTARTQSELTELFLDLPDPRPGQQYGSEPRPSSATPEVPPAYGYEQYGYDQNDYSPAPLSGQRSGVGLRPWYAQWWMIIIAVVLTGALRGFPIILLMALWLWVIYPALENRRQVQQPAVPPRPLTYSEREWVMEEVRAGRKINAIKRYRELTGAGLRDAKEIVDSWSRQIGR